MPWQEWAVVLLVAGAALYLARRTWRTWSGRASCGGCGKGCAEPPAQEAAPTFIPAGELTIRRR